MHATRELRKSQPSRVEVRLPAETGSQQEKAATSSQSFVSMPRLLRLFWLGLVLFAVLTVVSTVLLTHKHGTVYPYNNPVFQRVSFQADFVCFRRRFAAYGTPGFYTAPDPLPFTYPAPMTLVYQLFYGHTPRPHLAFLIASIAAYLVAAALFARALVKRNIRTGTAFSFAGTLFVLSSPAMLQLFLANMEVAVWILVALGMWAYARHRNWSASICFGLAASLKIFPFVYFALLLSRKKYKEIALGALLFAAVTLLSLHLLGPDIAAANRGIRVGLKYFQDVYVFMFHAPESGIDHSLFALIKLSLYHWRRTDLLPLIFRPYLLITASIGVLLYLLRIRHLPMFNQVLAIAVAAVLLPPVSHDYTLLHLYTPFVILALGMVTTPPDRRNQQLATALLACFLLLFSSENYLIHHGIRFAGQLKACVLLLLFGIALRWPIDIHLFPTWKGPTHT